MQAAQNMHVWLLHVTLPSMRLLTNDCNLPLAHWGQKQHWVNPYIYPTRTEWHHSQTYHKNQGFGHLWPFFVATAEKIQYKTWKKIAIIKMCRRLYYQFRMNRLLPWKSCWCWKNVFFYSKLVMIHYFTRATGVGITIMKSMTKAVQFTYLFWLFIISSGIP